MRNIWFTSDTHLNHKNIIKYCDRPFSCVEEMNEKIIENWNSLVKKNDIVYHLGDFCFGDPEEFTNRLNGHIALIRGNHDRRTIKLVHYGFFYSVQDILQLKHDGKLIYLSHYAHRVWNECHYGSYHLYGHSHGNLEPYNLSFDVGVDVWDFKPISWDTISNKIEELNEIKTKQC